MNQTSRLFFEDFDGSGPGFDGPVFKAWSIGGAAISHGYWKLFYPEYDGENISPGSGKYAGVYSHSGEFRDTLVWMISPLIDISQYQNLKLSADIYFRSSGISRGEDRLTISYLTVGVEPINVAIIGKDMCAEDAPISANKSWNISLGNRSQVIQLSFSWYSSMGPTEYDSVQIDNVLFEADKGAYPVPPANLHVTQK